MRRIIAIAALLLIVVVLWWRWPVSTPAEFDALMADLRDHDHLEIVVGWPDPRLPTDREVILTLRADNTASAATGSAVLRYDGAVALEIDGFSVPLPDLTPRAEALLDELRGGFSRSTWRTITPPAFGLIRPAPDAAWASISLPFDWADGVEVLLAVDRADGHLRYLMLSGHRAPFTVSTRPIRGGLRTVTLADDPFVRLPVRSFSRNPAHVSP